MHRQLYIALLRVTDIRGLSLLLPQNRDGMTANIIYPEVLLNSSSDSIAAAAVAGQ